MFNFNNQHSIIRILRFIAAFGISALTFYEIFSVSEIKSNQHYSFYALFLIACGVLISLFILRDSAAKILRNPDILIPAGLYISASYLIGFFGQSSMFIGFINGSYYLTKLTIWSVFAALLQIFITICFTGWITRVFLQFVRTEKVELIDSFKSFGWWFPRTFAVMIFSGLPLVSLLAFSYWLMTTGRSSGMFSEMMIFLIIFIGVSALFWSFASSAVLPYLLWVKIKLKRGIQEGITFSWKNRRKVFLPVILLMLTCGWINFISVNYSAPKGDKSFGESPGYSNQQSKWTVSTNFVWVGSYPEKSDWNKNMLKAVEAEPLSSVDFRIGLLILFLSLVVNLKIIETIFGNRKSEISDTLSSSKNPLTRNQQIIPLFAAVAVLFPFEIFTAGSNIKNIFAASEFAVSKVYKGEGIFIKNKFFEIGQHNTYEHNHPGGDAFQLGSIRDISVLGSDSKIVISGDRGALVFDKNSNLSEKIKFNLGKEKDSQNSDSYFKKVEAFDLEDNGKYTFAGIADSPYQGIILDHLGEIIWRFDDVKDTISFQNITLKDVDSDGEKEIVAEDSGTIRFFSLKGEEKWSQDSSATFLGGGSVLLDIDGDGKDEIVFTDFQKGTVRRLKEDSFEEIKRPYEQHGFLSEGVETPLIVFFDQNKLGLFDFNGNLTAQYQAPLSYIEDTSFFIKTNDYGPPIDVQPFRASAVKVKLKSDKPDYLAVLVTLSTKTGTFFVDMLYIYDENGELIFQESTKGGDHLMKILPLENGAQGLLIQEEEVVWLYKAD